MTEFNKENLINRLKNIEKSSLVSICSYLDTNFDLMCDFCKKLVKEANSFNPIYSMTFNKPKLRKNYKKICIYSMFNRYEEIAGEVYEIITSNFGQSWKCVSLPREDCRNIHIKSELSTNEIEEDIKKIKPDYIFVESIRDIDKQRVELMEFVKRIAKENNIAVFVLFNLRGGMLSEKEDESLKDFDEKCFKLSDIVLLIDDAKQRGDFKVKIEKGEL